MKIIILAGGKGTRLWPLSTPRLPKQFLQMEGDYSFLQKTILRFVSSYGFENIFIVTGESYQSLAEKQCLEIDPEGRITVIVEPSSRSTAPSFAFALQFLESKEQLDPFEPILLTPSDGFITLEKAFLENISFAAKKSKEGFFVLLGAAPTKVETGYGYIEIGQELDGLFKVERFIEKPSQEIAEVLFLDRRVFWNTGHLVTTASTFWKEVAVYCPKLQGPFEEMPEISLDYALLEKSRKVFCVKMDSFWSDIGSWDNIYAILPKKKEGNVQIGNTLSIECKNSLLASEKRLVVGIGLEDMLVVETEDAILVCKKGLSQKVKEIRQEKTRTVARPWGFYTVLEERESYKVKKIFVEPGKRLSLQMHEYRSEHWVIVKGEAFVEVGEKSFFLKENENVFVSPLTRHRLSNKSEDFLEVIEVQMGEVLDEEDIIRFEDDYARDTCTIC